MALDPSIILQAGRGVTPLESPMDAMGKALALKNQFQQTQMGGLQMSQLQREIKNQQDLQDTIRGAAGLDDALQKASKLGTKPAMEFVQKSTEMRHKGIQLSLDQNKLANDHLAKVGSGILSVANMEGATPEMVQDYVNREAQAGNLDPKGLADTLSTLPKDAAGLKDWAKLQAVKLGTAKDVIGLFTPKTEIKDTGSALISVNTDPLTGRQVQGGVVAKKTVTPGELLSAQTTRRGQDMGVGIYNGTPGVIPQAPRAATQPGGSTPAPASLDERLANVPAGIRDLVKQVGTYQMMPTQIGPRQKTAVMSLVAQAFPNYSVGDAEANVKFMRSLAASDPSSAGGTIAASERLLGHIGELADLTDKMGNSQFGKLGNFIGGSIDKATGTGQAGTIKSFELAKGKVIAELNKLANGGVPHAEEMKEDVKQLTFSDPPEVKYKVLQTAAGLGLEQTRAKEAQRDNLLGEFSPRTSFLSPKAQGVVRRVWKNAGAEAPELLPPTTGAGYTTTAQIKEQPAPKTILRASPQEAAKLPKGTRFIGLDGVERVKN